MSMGMVVFVDKKSKIMTLSMNSGVFVDKVLILLGLSTNRGQIMDRRTCTIAEKKMLGGEPSIILFKR